jgi:hydrogenase maturation protein HypF
MGRLFDAVSALIGIRGVIQYEAQAAIDLETLAAGEAGEAGSYPFVVIEQDGTSIIKVRDLFSAIIGDLQSRTPKAVIAARFHNTIGRLITELCQKISSSTGITGVALSGGVFQNRLLLRQTTARLESTGLNVYTHRQVPCNDGGISLGQVVIAHYNEEKQ